MSVYLFTFASIKLCIYLPYYHIHIIIDVYNFIWIPLLSYLCIYIFMILAVSLPHTVF